MTTHRLLRCHRCGSEYSYQGSGRGAPRFNNAEYCVSCAQIVHEALAKVPRLFECRYRNIKEMPEAYSGITLPILLEWEKEQLSVKKEGQMFPNIQRVFPGLYNLETGDHQCRREIRGNALPGDVSYQGQRFMLAMWEMSGEYEISVPMEWT